MSSKKTEILCAYCDSVWDYSKNEKCPYCGAAPDLKQIEAAHAREAKQIKQNTEAAAIKNPGKALSVWVASKLWLWVILFLAFTIIPFISLIIFKSIPSPKPAVSPQIVESVDVVKHLSGEEFSVTDYMSVNVANSSAKVLKNSSINALIPENYKILLIKISAKGDGKSHSLNYIKNGESAEVFGEPYIISDGVAYNCVETYDLKNLTVFEPELSNVIMLDSDYRVSAVSGYLCYIVPVETSSCTIYFESAHYTKKLRYLDKVHAVELTVEEVEE